MGLKLECKDLGAGNCPYVAHGETEEELLADAGAHGKKVHGYTDEQLSDPKMVAAIKAAVKKE